MTKQQKKAHRGAVRKTYNAIKARKREAEINQRKAERIEAERIAAIRLKEDQDFFEDFLK